MIEIKNYTFKYGNFPVFDRLDVTFKEGNIYGVLGENGVGKTTLLKSICSLQHNGKATYNTITIDGMNPFERKPELLSEIYLITDELPSSNEKVIDFAVKTGAFYPDFDLGQFKEYAHEFEVDINRKFSKLSFGQQKKAHIALGLALNTKYLLMDEPTNGMDIPSKATFRSLMARQCTDEKVFIISTHQVKDIENMIDPIIILDKERVLLNASAEEITQKLYFDYSGHIDENALYREASAAGMIQVSINNTGAESKLNLEALFNTVYRNKDLTASLFCKEERQ